MKPRKIKVALIFGGRSAEHEISLVSATSIYKNLDKKKFEIISIYINRKGGWRVVESPLVPPSSLKKGRFFSFLPWEKKAIHEKVSADIYFPVLHGPYGEDGTIQGFFEMAGVPYVGAAVLGSAVAMDKAITKTILKMKKVPVVKHLILLEEQWKKAKDSVLSKIKKEFCLPIFVKPANLGSSVGITKVKKPTQISAALRIAFFYDRKVLVEERIKGRELECSVLGNENPEASLPGELIPFREFYDYSDKYIEGKTTFQMPAKLPTSIVKKIQRLSIEAFKAIDCSGMARVDFFLEEKTNKIFLSELNTIPGFTEISMYPKLWEVSGLSYPRLLEKLIQLGFERQKRKKRGEEKFIP
ncbi:MAG: D-alanine--D-alanine ligase [Candidatus Aminicenantes bacterium]|nr:MAG: D-alanine--D-alanine ligase [Candidatus Aminicenantes bacterium]